MSSDRMSNAAHNSTHGSIWERIGNWFRHLFKPQPSFEDALPAGPGGPMPIVTENRAKSVAVPSNGGGLMRRRNEDSIERLQEGYTQVTHLIESIQRHMEVQGERSTQIVDALSKLANHMADTSANGRDQSAKLESIARELGTINKRGDRFDEAVTRFVDLASAQREAVGVLSQQIESTKQTEARSIESMNAFRQAVTTFTEASTASTGAITQLNRRDEAREERLEQMTRQHNQRFTMMFVLALFLSVAAVMIGLNAMLQ